ncbi:hypothetical protein B9Z55_008532 [Caenorhabditis nigoni]|nr:hypothetical protein B9Z55_008532 [Caenorhabditis nigoni]
MMLLRTWTRSSRQLRKQLPMSLILKLVLKLWMRLKAVVAEDPAPKKKRVESPTPSVKYLGRGLGRSLDVRLSETFEQYDRDHLDFMDFEFMVVNIRTTNPGTGQELLKHIKGVRVSNVAHTKSFFKSERGNNYIAYFNVEPEDHDTISQRQFRKSKKWMDVLNLGAMVKRAQPFIASAWTVSEPFRAVVVAEQHHKTQPTLGLEAIDDVDIVKAAVVHAKKPLLDVKNVSDKCEVQ